MITKKTRRKKMKGGNRYKSIRKYNKKMKGGYNNNNSNICAPFTDGGTTCFTKRALLNILKSWNNYYPDNKIVYNKDNKSNLWGKINEKLNNKCNNDYCWTEQEFLNTSKENLRKEYFKPHMPEKWQSNFNEWLNTLDINKVMKQYEKKYDDFIFIGAVPMDFDKKINPGECVIDELCNVNVKDLIKQNKTKLGIVFNLDNHDEDGSHWVSFFCKFGNSDTHIYYFDSYGIKETKEIRKLINRIKEQTTKMGNPTHIHINKIRHQFKNSECGIYSLNFIIRLLNNESFDSITNNITKDDEMQNNRNNYFLNTKNI